MATPTFDPANIIQIFAGVPIVGQAKGTFVKAERTGNTFEVAAGTTGEVARRRLRDKTGLITHTIVPWSTTNDLLSAITQLDELAGAGIGPSLVSNLNGVSLAEANDSWIQKPPALEYAEDFVNREWPVMCGELLLFIGGEIG